MAGGVAAHGEARRTELWIALGFVTVGLVTRLVGHINSGLWFDEIWTLIDFIRLPFGTLVTTYGSDNNHPLFSLLAWLSTHALGESPLTLRLPAVLFGAASLGMLYWLARQLTDRSEALLATGLLLISYHHVWFSQNARGYTILLFSTLAASHFFLKTLEPDAPRRAFLWQGFWLAAGTFAHASAVFVALGQLAAYLVWLWLGRGGEARPHRYRPLLGVIAGGLISLAMHAGILLDLIAYFTHDTSTTPAPAGKSEWHSPWWTVKATAESLGFGLWPGLVAMLGGLSVIAIGGLSYLRRAPVATLAFILPAVGSVLILLMGRSLRPRFLFFEAGFFLLFIVRGMFVSADWLAKLTPAAKRESTARGLRIAGSVAAMGAFLVMLPRAYTLPKQDFEGAMAYAQGLQGPSSVVMTIGLAVLPYQAYYKASFTPVEDVASFDAALQGKQQAFAIHTIPVYLDAFKPELAAVFHARAKELKRFAGSMGDGDVIVYEIGPKHAAEGERR